MLLHPGTRWNKKLCIPETKLGAKTAGCAGNKITERRNRNTLKGLSGLEKKTIPSLSSSILIISYFTISQLWNKDNVPPTLLNDTRCHLEEMCIQLSYKQNFWAANCNYLLTRQCKNMFWVLKRSVSWRCFFEYTHHIFWLRNERNSFHLRCLQLLSIFILYAHFRLKAARVCTCSNNAFCPNI